MLPAKSVTLIVTFERFGSPLLRSVAVRVDEQVAGDRGVADDRNLTRLVSSAPVCVDVTTAWLDVQAAGARVHLDLSGSARSGPGRGWPAMVAERRSYDRAGVTSAASVSVTKAALTLACIDPARTGSAVNGSDLTFRRAASGIGGGDLEGRRLARVETVPGVIVFARQRRADHDRLHLVRQEVAGQPAS
jgi:hypothetical protein